MHYSGLKSLAEDDLRKVYNLRRKAVLSWPGLIVFHY